MARALDRAAERFEAEAIRLEDLRERRRKPHSGDDSAVVARTLHNVARQLRGWARLCLAEQSTTDVTPRRTTGEASPWLESDAASGR